MRGFLLLVLISSLLVSCGSPSKVTRETKIESNSVISSQQASVLRTVEVERGKSTLYIPEGLEGVNWVSPGKVNISNFFPGARVDYYITIHNGSIDPAQFSIYYKNPEGLVYAKDWVIISDSSVVLESRETRDILVSLQ